MRINIKTSDIKTFSSIKEFTKSLSEIKTFSSPSEIRQSEILNKIDVKHTIIKKAQVKKGDILINIYGTPSHGGSRKVTVVEFHEVTANNVINSVIKSKVWSYTTGSGVWILSDKNNPTIGSMGFNHYFEDSYEFIKLLDPINYQSIEDVKKLVLEIDKVASKLYNWWYEF